MIANASMGTVKRARNGNFAVFAANGMLLASWFSRIPDVKHQLQLTPGSLSLLLLSLSIGALLGLPIAGRVANRLGATNTVRAGMLIAAAGVLTSALAVQFAQSLLLAMLGMLLLGLGSGTCDVAMNLEGTVIEQAIGRAIMPWFHAAFSGGTVVGALLGAGATAIKLPLAVHQPTTVAISLALVIWGSAQFMPATKESPAEIAASKVDAKSPWLEPRTLLIGFMVLAAAFTEGTANDWMAVAFVDGHQLAPALGVLGTATFLVFMTTGRILGTSALDRFGRVPVLRGLFAAAVVGSLLVVFGTPPLAYLGAAIWGIGASLGFPVGMSAASDDPKRAAVRISAVATIGYVAFLAGPMLIGFLGDRVGVLRALLAVGAASAIAFGLSNSAKEPTK